MNVTTRNAEEPILRTPSLTPEQVLETMEEEELRHHLRSLQLVTEAILAHLTLPELLRELLARLRTILPVDTATILLCTERGDTLAVRASKGLEEEVEQHIEIPMGKGIAGVVAVRRQAVIVDDMSRVDPVSPLLRRLSSMMVAPLVVAEQVLGVLHVGTLQPHTFRDSDLHLLQVVADRVALAIKNAKTYDEQQREALALARAKEEIREIGDRFRLLFERSPLPMWVFDPETLGILDANEAAAQHYGWTREELLGMTIRDIRPPDDVPKLDQVLGDESRGLVQRGLFRHRRKDGSVIDVEVTTRELEYNGRPSRIALIVDVTRDREAMAERARLTAEIDRQRLFLQTITDNATSALMMMDTRGRGTFWNPAAERITGYSAEEAVGRTLHELVHHTHPDGSPFPIEECPIDQALPDGVDVEGYEDVFIRKDGTFFPVVCSAKPIMEGGRPVGTVIEVRDVTEQKQAEDALRRAKDEAELANQAKTEFLSAMSHELRTPLNAIAGYVDLIDAGIHGPITPEQHHALERVKRNQRQLLTLINDVLHFTKLEAGRLHFDISETRLDEVLQGLRSTADLQAQSRGVQFSQPPCDPPLVVLADEDRVQQILRNLVSNAIKFTPAGGSVRVHCHAEPDRVLIHVEDTGRGIPEERLESIFDPFVQLERHRHETSNQGVGLGLAISRDLARAMGGELTVRSKVGQGSTFTLSLPRAPGSGSRD